MEPVIGVVAHVKLSGPSQESLKPRRLAALDRSEGASKHSARRKDDMQPNSPLHLVTVGVGLAWLAKHRKKADELPPQGSPPPDGEFVYLRSGSSVLTALVSTGRRLELQLTTDKAGKSAAGGCSGSAGGNIYRPP